MNVGVLEIPLAIAVEAFLIVPIGALTLDTLVGPGNERHRDPVSWWAMAAGTGYLATTLLVLGLGLMHALAALPYLCAGAALALMLRRHRWRGYATDDARRETRLSAIWLAVIVGLSLYVVLPFMAPVRADDPHGVVSYAYIDAYQSLGVLQGLIRSIPLAEHASLAGLPPRIYPDFHYMLLAAVARLTHASASDTYFVHGTMLLVLVGIPLAFAVGRALTGTPLGGLVGAAMLYLGVVPNPFDLNTAFANDPVPYMPTFAQIHFFSPRFNQHEGAGLVLIMTALVATAWALLEDRTRGKVGALVIGGCAAAALARFRSQHALSFVPAFTTMTIWVAWRDRDRRYLMGPLACLMLLALLSAQSLSGRYDTAPAGMLLRYGEFGRDLLQRWYLPARLRDPIARLPFSLAAPLAIAAWVIFRVIGLNFMVLIAARTAAFVRLRRRLHVIEAGVLAAIATAGLTALLLRRVTIGIGFQTLAVAHPLAMILAIPIVATLSSAVAAAAGRRRRRVALAVLALFSLTLVSHRAAESVLHDQPQRAYPIATSERDAYAWISTHADRDAVVAAHPDHVVNPSGETVRATNVLTAWTDRRVYLQRAGVDQRALVDARAEQIRDVFAARSDDVCGRLNGLAIDYLLTYRDTPLAAPDAACLVRVFSAGDTSVWRVGPPSTLSGQ